MEAPEISWRPRGQLFVEKGLLDEERLEHALAGAGREGWTARRKAGRARYVSVPHSPGCSRSSMGSSSPSTPASEPACGPSSSAGTTTMRGRIRNLSIRPRSSRSSSRRRRRASCRRTTASSGTPGSKSSGRDSPQPKRVSPSSSSSSQLRWTRRAKRRGGRLPQRTPSRPFSSNRRGRHERRRARTAQEAHSEAAQLARKEHFLPRPGHSGPVRCQTPTQECDELSTGACDTALVLAV